MIEHEIESFVGAEESDEIITLYSYDHRHRVESVVRNYVDGAAATADQNVTVSYGYDAVGNTTSVTDPLGRTTSYEYDLLNRPVRVTEPDPDGAGELLARHAARSRSIDYRPW